MNRVDWVRSFVHRSFRGVPSYVYSDNHELSANVPRVGDEILVGLYFNVPGSLADVIAITDRGMCLRRSDGWRLISYDQVVKTVVPPKSFEPPHVAPYLDLHLHDGEVVRVAVRGRSGESRQFSDVYRMEQFLRGMAWSLAHSEAAEFKTIKLDV